MMIFRVGICVCVVHILDKQFTWHVKIRFKIFNHFFVLLNLNMWCKGFCSYTSYYGLVYPHFVSSEEIKFLKIVNKTFHLLPK